MRNSILLVTAFLFSLAGMAQKAAIPPDPATERKVESYLQKMTMEEKIGQMVLLEINMITSPENEKYTAESLMKLTRKELGAIIHQFGLETIYDAKSITFPASQDDTKNYLVFYNLSQAIQARSGFKLDEALLDTVFGVYKAGGILNAPGKAQSPETWHQIVKRIQEKSMQEIGIPCIYGIDQMHGTTYTAGGTIFPQEINMAATFNRQLAHRMGEISAYETRACSLPWCYSPVFDLGRQFAWSRVYEGFGEDALLAGEMGSQLVSGLQGNDPGHIGKEHVAACLKHYFAYGTPNSGVDRTPSFIDEQNLREKQFAPFLAGFRAGALSTMTNSSTLNGMNGVANKRFLTGWLKQELNWDGMIVTDWGDIENLVNRDHIASSRKDAICMAINAGVDMMMVPSELSYGPLLKQLVNEGRVPAERIDDAVRRILRLKYRLNLFDQPISKVEDYPLFGSAGFAGVALQAAEESEVLLKNENQVLPLNKGARILVCGPNANSMRCLNGGWTYTWQGSNTEEFTKNYHTILRALQDTYGAENIIYQPGVEYKSDGNWYEEVSDIDKAVEAAGSVDYIIACIGENTYAETVGNITDLNLSINQKNLVRALENTGKPVILILNEGRPRLVYDLVPGAKAVIDIMLPGNYGGDALANLISGRSNFSGKLPFTYPIQPNGIINYDYKVGEENTTLTGTYDYSYKANASYQWLFGSGLSYTNYEYRNLQVNKKEFRFNDELEFTIQVKNTGNRSGKETVLLYSTDQVASLMPDNKRLRAFDKIELQPGETKTVKFNLKASDLAFVDADAKWILEKGDFTIAVGSEKVVVTCIETHRWETPNIE